MKEAWKVYINYGRGNEMSLVDAQIFKTKKSAIEFCKKFDYPQKCVMRESEWRARKWEDAKNKEEFKKLNSITAKNQ